jgi:hypothetical protein
MAILTTSVEKTTDTNIWTARKSLKQKKEQKSPSGVNHVYSPSLRLAGGCNRLQGVGVLRRAAGRRHESSSPARDRSLCNQVNEPGPGVPPGVGERLRKVVNRALDTPNAARLTWPNGNMWREDDDRVPPCYAYGDWIEVAACVGTPTAEWHLERSLGRRRRS